MRFLKKYFLFSALVVGMVACKEEESTEVVMSPSVVQFSQPSWSWYEDEVEKMITLSFSQAAPKDGSLSLSLESSQLTQFVTEPSMVNGKITLPVTKGSTSISFRVKAVDNSLLDGDKQVTITISQLSEGLKWGTARTATLTVIDNETKVTANFLFGMGTIRESDRQGAVISITLSSSAVANGVILVSTASDKLIYGTDYTTEPAFANSKIVLPVAPGVDQVSFKIFPINNISIHGEQTIKFRIESAEGGLIKGTSEWHEFKIIDDETAANARGYEVTAGLWRTKRYYEYAANGDLLKVTWEQYTPAYKGGTYSYVYHQGRLHKMVENERRETYYVWEGNRIVKTEEYTNGLLTQLILYGYDQAGNIGETAIHYLQPNGEMKLGLVFVYLYYTNGNIYKKMAYNPVEGQDEYSLIETHVYENYLDVANPFSMVEILPNVNAQPQLPGNYRLEKDGKEYRYQFTYQFDANGRPTSRTTSSSNGSETVTYHYN